MAIYKEDIVDINLSTGNIHRTFLAHTIGYKDQKADHFGVRVFRDGEAVDLTGVSVQGIFMPPQGDPIAITSGNSVSGNVAYVVLPQACYNYDGQFCLAIKLVDSTNSITGTVRIVDGVVDNTHASGTVAPTSAVPTYQEILSTYDAMVAATAAANGCIAATYSSSATYAVGDYCIHDGGLYRCTTAITTAEAWTSGHWTAAKIGPDVSALKSALMFDENLINEGQYTIQESDMESGYWGYSTKMSNAKRLCCSYLIPVRKGMKIRYANPTKKVYFGILETQTSQTYLYQSGWIASGGNNDVIIGYDGYMTFMVESTNNITPNDYDCTFTISTELKQFDDSMRFAPVDLVSGGTRNNTTNAGITFTWNENKTACTVNGTVSGDIPATQYFNGSTTAMPNGFKAGGTYHVTLKSTSNYAGIGVYYYKNNGTYYASATFRTDTTFTIPSDATGMIIYVFVEAGKTVSNDVVSDFGIFECATNAQIAERTEQLYNEAKKSLEDGSYLLNFKRKKITDNQNKTYVPSQNSLTTDVLYFDNKFLKIVVDSGYRAVVYYKSQINTYIYRELNEGQHFFYAGSSIPVVFSLFKNPTAIISADEAKHITVTDIDAEAVENICCGIYGHNLLFDGNGAISADYLYYYTSNEFTATQPIRIPKSGLRIGYNEKYHSKEYQDGETYSFPNFRVVAVKKGNNGLVLQTDDEDILAVSQSETRLPYSVYIPYIEDCYIIIVQNRPDYMDALYVTSGEVERSFCGVYNIFPTALRVVDNENENTLDIKGSQSDWYSYSSMLYFATVLRLRDVRKIVCGPKYTLLAEIYKINNDGAISRYDDVWGTFVYTTTGGSQINTSGLSVIDFEQYDFDGFALVAIQSTIKFIKADNEYGYSIRRMTTGNLGGYEDVIRSVCVDYKNGVSISKVPGMPSILEENIHRLMNWKVPEYGSGFYVEQASTVRHYFPTQYDCVPSMYNGTYVANSLLMQVTAKSALTCMKNRNGRMRKMQRIQPSQGTPTKGNIGFGLTCTNFTSVIRGLKENYASSALVYGDNKKFDRLDFNYKTDLDKLRPGDVLTKHNMVDEPVLGRISDSHCITVESIIEVNGVIKAVNIIEATIPYCRRATFIDEEYYMSNANWIVKMYTIDKLKDYKWICRIKPEYLKPITQTFDMYPASTDVGTVMCDRGTDSIYGINTPYIELSFKNEDVAQNLYLYKNGSGSPIATIPKSGASTVNSLQLINIKDYIDGEGLYTVKTDPSGDVQETFYVKGNIDKILYHDTELTTELYIPNITDFIWMEVWYDPGIGDPNRKYRQSRTYIKADANDENPPAVDVVPITETVTVTVDNYGTPAHSEQITITPEMNYGHITVPRYVHTPGAPVDFEILSIDTVHETQYGTYWASMGGWVSSDHYSADKDVN